MIEVKTFPFNPFAMNTYVVFDETGDGIIIDAGNSHNGEHQILLDFLKQNKINIKGLYLTHSHIDHILGIKFLSDYFKMGVHYHPAGDFLFAQANDYAESLGFSFEGMPSELIPIDENHIIKFGDSIGKVLYTPGHVDGSVCYYFEQDSKVFVGDVLFRQGIGRTDLPTGDYELLEKSIKQKLYKLPNEVTAFPGHGPTTTIGFEKKNNPFFQV